MELLRMLILLSILLCTSAIYVDYPPDVMYNDEMMEILEILTGEPQYAPKSASGPDEVTEEQLESSTSTESSQETTTELPQTSTLAESPEEVTSSTESSQETTTELPQSSTLAESPEVTTKQSNYGKKYGLPIPAVRSKRSVDAENPEASARKRSHWKQHRRMMVQRKLMDIPHAVEKLLRSIPEVNVTEPWLVDTNIMYGPGDSIHIHVNVTAMPKNGKINCSPSHMKHVRYWQAIGKHIREQEYMEDMSTQRRPIVPYPFSKALNDEKPPTMTMTYAEATMQNLTTTTERTVPYPYTSHVNRRSVDNTENEQTYELTRSNPRETFQAFSGDTPDVLTNKKYHKIYKEKPFKLDIASEAVLHVPTANVAEEFNRSTDLFDVPQTWDIIKIKKNSDD